jgi:hypothetical protein
MRSKAPDRERKPESECRAAMPFAMGSQQALVALARDNSRWRRGAQCIAFAPAHRCVIDAVRSRRLNDPAAGEDPNQRHYRAAAWPRSRGDGTNVRRFKELSALYITIAGFGVRQGLEELRSLRQGTMLSGMLVRLAEKLGPRRACTLRMWQPLICGVPHEARQSSARDQTPSINPSQETRILP